MPAELRLLWDEVRVAFEGVDLILHSGDIVHPIVLDQLESWAPVVAALGNNDFCANDPRVALTQWVEIEGFRIAMVHDMEPEDEPIDALCRRYLRGQRPDVIVTGHTHYERMDSSQLGQPGAPASVVHSPRHRRGPRSRPGVPPGEHRASRRDRRAPQPGGRVRVRRHHGATRGVNHGGET